MIKAPRDAVARPASKQGGALGTERMRRGPARSSRRSHGRLVLGERDERRFEAETAIEPAHRRRGEVLVLLGTSFDNPPTTRSFDLGDEHHFSARRSIVASLNGASHALRPTQIVPERRMSTEREGSHRLLCRESEFNLDIGRVG
jgi:hypothetical protein